MNLASRACLLLSGTAFAFLLAQASPIQPPVDYPAGYRDWPHVKTQVVRAAHPGYAVFGGIHHIYANSVALQGYRNGQFADGAVIVFDLLTGDEQPAELNEGERRYIDVMVKDSARYAATGGWGFEEFGGNGRTGRLTAERIERCFECHKNMAPGDLVVSDYRL